MAKTHTSPIHGERPCRASTKPCRFGPPKGLPGGKTEAKAIEILKNNLDKGIYQIRATGGSNSTTPDALIMKNKKKFRKVEIKQLPSAAGAQTVVERNSTDDGYSTTQTKPYTKLIMELVEAHKDDPLSKDIELSGTEADTAFEAFETKYSSDEVGYFIGMVGEQIVGCKPTKELLAERFNAHLTIRAKKSGSSSMPKKDVAGVKQKLSSTIPTVMRNNKIFITDLTKIEEANTILKNHVPSVKVGNRGEIRRLGSTNNVTAMLSFSLKRNLDPKYFLTEQQLAEDAIK